MMTRRTALWAPWVGVCLCWGCSVSDPPQGAIRDPREDPKHLAAFRAALSSCSGTECCPAGYQILEGTAGQDTIAGGNGSGCLVGLGANDTLSGGNAPDWIDGGEGDDVCSGGFGNDTLFGGEGDDTLIGSNGNDLLRGGPGRDTMQGGLGNDTFVVANVCETAPFETIDGGLGDDTLRTSLTLSELAELGVQISSIEHIVPLAPEDEGPECQLPLPGSFGSPDAPPAERLCRVLAQTAAVVRGQVSAIAQVYEEQVGFGPRRVVELTNVTTILGGEQLSNLKLRVLGGELPSGDELLPPHLPRFQVGASYVVFLSRMAWKLAPVPIRYYFRVRENNGQELLIDEGGFVMTGPIGQLIRRSYAPVWRDPAQPLDNPLSTDELLRAASVPSYSTELQILADACPEGPTGVFSPFPRTPWNIFNASPDLPIGAP